jgi:ABC-type lipoprotein export system ATPase subunit
MIEHLNEFRSEFKHLSTLLLDKQAELTSIQNEIRDRLKLISHNEIALSVVKKMLEISNNETVNVFSKFITTGLRTIFQEDYAVEFVIRDRGPKNKIISIKFIKDGGEPQPIYAIGGGVQVIIGFLLQVIILKVFNKRMFILLDESLVQVSRQYIPNTMRFIKEMTREHGLVVMMITHVDLSEYSDVAYVVNNGEVTNLYTSPDIIDEDPSVEVIVKNFQNISFARIKANGFTTIMGASNNGKSALFRSIIYSLRNEPGDYYIKQGEKVCKTALAFNNFHGQDDVLVKWTKGKTAKLSITMNEETTDFEKLGRGEEAISELYKPYNLNGVKLGELFLTPNWWEQLDKPLTTELDGKSDLFKLFNSMSGTERLMKIINELGEDLKELQNERKKLNVQADMLSVEVGELTNKTELYNNALVKIDPIEETINMINSKIEALQHYIAVNSDLDNHIDKSKTINSLVTYCTNMIDTAINTVKLADYQQTVNHILSTKRQIEITINIISSLQKLISTIENVHAMNGYILIDDNIKKKCNYIAAFDELIPRLSATMKKSQIINSMDSFITVENMIGGASKNISAVTDISKCISDTIKLADRLIAMREYKQITENIEKCNTILSHGDLYDNIGVSINHITVLKEYENINTAIKQKQDELAEINKQLKSIDVCPLCGSVANF